MKKKYFLLFFFVGKRNVSWDYQSAECDQQWKKKERKENAERTANLSK